ncbi:hypothetical protein M406DRAFT_327490 [Cryphonectria parasitica EP155]|uniref:Uncharacterized protein n=1 Tax=Cryphonectria parasitica (strain ATCC 38755 / EP155) TaxID=660469 RepID=A0A9P5CT64_CRYP1|nr:uncharacterized protein M406DRAFT_327490 [Cryphonectria parasitica EP155]KAF3769086.1 hypothetical protein M406DRAFT_327490 [Cryphonectria parasitica EP155]
MDREQLELLTSLRGRAPVPLDPCAGGRRGWSIVVMVVMKESGSTYYDLIFTDEVIDDYVNFVEIEELDKDSSTMLYWVYEYAADEMLLRIIKFAGEKHQELVAGKLAFIVSDDSELVSLCSFFPLVQAMIEHGVQNGGNSMGLEEVSQGKNGSIFLASLAISGEDSRAKAYPLVKQQVDEVDEYAASLGLNWGLAVPELCVWVPEPHRDVWRVGGLGEDPECFFEV